MAFLDLEIGSLVGSGQRTEARRRLERQDRQVVLLARADRLPSQIPGARLLGRLLGMEAPRRLADPRLEALRRYAVTYRLAPAREVAEGEAAQAAGLSPVTLALTRDLVDRGRRPQRSTTPRRLLAVGAKVFASGVAAITVISGLEPLLNSRLLASMLAGIAGVIVAPFIARAGQPTEAGRGAR